ncbi:hypothetical protein JCM8547_005124 [Rhodosporidiobolus lusitaniae]
MANWAGITASLSALVRPSTLQPRLSVPSIAHLDWHKLKYEGRVTGVVVDKDNCIAKPSEDQLAPDPALRASWDTLLQTFGPENVLVVSNSAGTLAKDPLLLQAESVSRNLGVPVLVHKSPKPGYPCVRQVAAHFLLTRTSTSSTAALPAPPPTTSRSNALRGQVIFSPLARAKLASSSSSLSLTPPAPSSIPSPSPPPSSSSTPLPPRLLIIGDRLATDMILSHRLSQLPLPLSLPSSSPPPPLSRTKRLLSLFHRTPRTLLGAMGQRIETVAVLTTTLHAREGLGTTLLRGVEKAALGVLQARKRRRAWRKAVEEEGKKGTELEGVEGGKRVEDVEWERFLIDHIPPPPAPSPSPLPSTSVSSPSPSPPIPASRSSVPLLHRLQSLPTSLSIFFHSLPSRFSLSLRRALHRLSLALQRSLPRLLASLHKPLSQLVGLYTQREPPSSLSHSSPSSSSSAAKSTVDLAERLVQRVEKAVERPLGTVKGLTALARARAEEVGRLREGVRGLPGLAEVRGRKEGRKVEKGK